MRKMGIADLPLHYGRCPKWLFPKMVKLSRIITETIILEFGIDEFLKNISDPFFFQSLGCIVGYDYHSSGVTTTLMGALKEALSIQEHGIAVCGGKGKASRETQKEIEDIADTIPFTQNKIEELKYVSRIVAKVDNSAIQAGYPLYHHSFIFTEKGKWAVIQQGMNTENRYARRYHWLSDDVKNFVVEPHKAIVSDRIEEFVLNLTSSKSIETQEVITDISKEGPRKVQNLYEELNDKTNVTLMDWIKPSVTKIKAEHLIMPRSINWDTARKLYDKQPENFEEVLTTDGVGPNTVRALALISMLIYGTEIDWKDPVKYSFCVGGKDGVPYPVNMKTYDKTIEVLQNAVKQSKMGYRDQTMALMKLGNLLKDNSL